MKNRRDQRLLAGFLLSAAIWFLCALISWGIIPVNLPDWLDTICGLIDFAGLVVPAYNLQLLLCRRAWRWVAALHILTIIGATLYLIYKAMVTTGLNSLGWVLLMIYFIAAALGCAIAWVTHGGEQKDAQE